MNQYVKTDIKRAFDLIQIAHDDIMQTATKHAKANPEYSDTLYKAKFALMDAIENLSHANTYKLKSIRSIE